MRNKILYLALIQAFAIMTVFIGHATHSFCPWGWWGHRLGVDKTLTYINYIIYSFHMPLFVFISGFLTELSLSKYPEPIKFLAKRIKRIIIPFFLWGTLYCLPIWIFVNPYNLTTQKIFTDFITGTNMGHLWFLPMLFFTTVLYLVLRKMPKQLSPIVLITMIILNFIHIKGFGHYAVIKSIHYLPYFYFGAMLFKFHEPIFSYKNLPIIAISTGILSLITLNTYSSILCIFTSAYLICKKFPKAADNKITLWISSNMFLLYILHEPIMMLILKLIKWHVVQNAQLTAFLLFTGTLSACILLINLQIPEKYAKIRQWTTEFYNKLLKIFQKSKRLKQ